MKILALPILAGAVVGHRLRFIVEDAPESDELVKSLISGNNDPTQFASLKEEPKVDKVGDFSFS